MRNLNLNRDINSITPKEKRNILALLGVLVALIVIAVIYGAATAGPGEPTTVNVDKNSDGSALVYKEWENGDFELTDAPAGTYSLTNEEYIVASFREAGVIQQYDGGFVDAASDICSRLSSGYSPYALANQIRYETDISSSTSWQLIEVSVEALCPSQERRLPYFN